MSDQPEAREAAVGDQKGGDVGMNGADDTIARLTSPGEASNPPAGDHPPVSDKHRECLDKVREALNNFHEGKSCREAAEEVLATFFPPDQEAEALRRQLQELRDKFDADGRKLVDKYAEVEALESELKDLRNFKETFQTMFDRLRDLQAEVDALKGLLSRHHAHAMKREHVYHRELDQLRIDTEAALSPTADNARKQTEWQPIETAPKDGTPFVGLKDGMVFRTSLGRYYVKWPHEEGGPTFREAWNAHDRDSICPWHPTHWMPLPKAPTAEQKEKV